MVSGYYRICPKPGKAKYPPLIALHGGHIKRNGGVSPAASI
jgi:hypothetical protein